MNVPCLFRVIYTIVYTHSCAGTCRSQRPAFKGLPQLLLYLILRQGLSVNLKLFALVRLTGQQAPKIYLTTPQTQPHSLAWGRTLATPGFYMGAGAPNLGLHAYPAWTLPTKPLPVPCLFTCLQSFSPPTSKEIKSTEMRLKIAYICSSDFPGGH